MYAKVKSMDAGSTVLLTVVVTVVLVLLVEALFFYFLVRLHRVDLHLTRQQCPCSRSQPAARCSNQVTFTSRTEQINETCRSSGSVVVSQPEEPHVGVICGTVSTTRHVTAAAADNGGGSDDGQTSADANRPDSKCGETVVKRYPAGRRHCGCRTQSRPSLPCSCWTTVSSEIIYENEQDGVNVMAVYQERMIVPSSCQRARQLATEPRRTLGSTDVKPSERHGSYPSKADERTPGGLPLCD